MGCEKMIHYYELDKQNILHELAESDSPVWLHIEEPTEKEISWIHTQFHTPKDYLSDALDNQEVARIEGIHQDELEQPILLLVQYPHTTVSPSGFQQYETFPLSIILTKNTLITVCNYPIDFLAVARDNFNQHSESETPEQIAMEMLWHLSLSFNQYLADLKKSTNTLESELRVAVENKQLYQIMDIQKSLIYFKAALEENLRVIKALRLSPLTLNSTLELESLRDILIESKQALSTTDVQSQIVLHMSNMFSSIVSNNLNIVMKVLTSLTIVLTIPTIIGGLYGMNVKLPIAQWPNAFWIICVAILILCILTIWILRKKKYF